MAYLMCMDTPVYDSSTKQILAKHLMPCPVEKYEEWRNSRMFLRGINRAPELDEQALGAFSRTVRRRLSLSDSYWIKYNADPVGSFSEVSPYVNEFFEYGVCVSTKSAPSLTVTGSINKNWKRLPNGETVLYKVMRQAWVMWELRAVALAQKLNLPVNKVTAISETELYVHNFTEPGKMLMRLQPWDLSAVDVKRNGDFGYTFTSVDKVYKNLGIEGNSHIVTVLFDAVVGNHDRIKNLTNWGYFKSGVSGKNTACPMFDFNLAHADQKNMFLHIVKKQITEEHNALLRQWKPVVASHGEPFWLENVNDLLNE